MLSEINSHTNTSNTLECAQLHLELELDRDKLALFVALNDIEGNFDDVFSTLMLSNSPCCS